MQQSMSFPLPWRFLLFLLKIQVIYMFTSTTRSFIHQNYHYHQRIASYDTTMMIRSSQDAVVIGGGVGGQGAKATPTMAPSAMAEVQTSSLL